MNKFRSLLIVGAAVLALGGVAAVAGDKLTSAESRTQTMTVQLPSGGVAYITYSGPVKPRVTFDEDAALLASFAVAPRVRFDETFNAFDPFGFWLDDFDREMQRVREMMDSMSVLARDPVPDGALLQASDGTVVPGSYSYSFTSTTTGGKTCARSVQVTAPAAGGKPEVVERTSGDCEGSATSATPQSSAATAL
jgi:hypothetical protein